MDDLSDDKKKCCDDIIIKLGDANGTKELPDDESRAGLWNSVFANDWNTNCPNKHPGTIRARRGVESMTQVGTWKTNLPTPTTPTKRKRDENTQVNQNRFVGAPAFIKPIMNWDDFGTSFSVCDAKSSAANAKYVNLNLGWTWQQARAEAMVHWDENEYQRVIEYNTRLAVCWARSRLLTSMRAASRTQAGGEGHGYNEITANTDELVLLVTCADKMKDMATLVEESNQIAQSRPIKKRKLADMA